MRIDIQEVKEVHGAIPQVRSMGLYPGVPVWMGGIWDGYMDMYIHIWDWIHGTGRSVAGIDSRISFMYISYPPCRPICRLG